MLLSKASREFEEKTRTLYLYFSLFAFCMSCTDIKSLMVPTLNLLVHLFRKLFRPVPINHLCDLRDILSPLKRTLSHYLFSYPKHFSLKTILFQCLSSTGIFHSSIHSHLTLLALPNLTEHFFNVQNEECDQNRNCPP